MKLATLCLAFIVPLALLGACTSLGGIIANIANPAIATDTLAVNADALKLKADLAAHAPVEVIAADSAKLATDTAALQAAIKAVQPVP